MNRLLHNIAVIALLCLSATGTEVPRPTGPAITKAIERCTQDYRETYRKGAKLTPANTRTRYQYVTAVEARRYHPNIPELREAHYLIVLIGKRLSKDMVGGSAYYLVSPTDGSIIYRWHTR